MKRLKLNLQLFADEEQIVNESEETQEVAEPAEERNLEKDSVFAEARRKFEADKKAEQAERDAWFAAEYAELGIKSESEFKAYRKAEKKKDLEEQAIVGDASAIEKLVNLNVDEKLSAKLAEEQAKMAAQKEMADEVSELNKAYGTDFTLDTLDEEVMQLMNIKDKNGKYYTAKKAYELLHASEIAEKKKAKEEAKANGYAHTGGVKSTNSQEAFIDVDQDTLKMYEKMGMKVNPEVLKNIQIG